MQPSQAIRPETCRFNSMLPQSHLEISLQFESYKKKDWLLLTTGKNVVHTTVWRPRGDLAFGVYLTFQVKSNDQWTDTRLYTPRPSPPKKPETLILRLKKQNRLALV